MYNAKVVFENNIFRVVLKRNNANSLFAIQERKTKDALGEVAWVEVRRLTTENEENRQFVLAMESLVDEIEKLQNVIKRIEKDDYTFG